MDLMTEQLTDGFWGLLPNRPLMTKNELISLLIILLENRRYLTTAVEIGCYSGGASRFIAPMIYPATLYCVDNFTINQKDVEPVFNNVLKEFNNIDLIKDTSNNASKYFTNNISFLFIDGDHSEQGIRDDCTNWLPKVFNSGIVAFHDYQPQFQCVINVVNEFTNGWEVLSHQDSLKIVRKP